MNPTSNSLRDLFFRTGLPEVYCLSRQADRRERAQEETSHAVYHTGDRPAGGRLPGGG